MDKIPEGDMDNDEHLLVTIYDGRDEEWEHLVKVAVTIKDGAAWLEVDYWREQEELEAITRALPIHVKDIGKIVDVEKLFWSG